jgi:hypothetical protein
MGYAKKKCGSARLRAHSVALLSSWHLRYGTTVQVYAYLKTGSIFLDIVGKPIWACRRLVGIRCSYV